jgi:hypothetical protein
MWIGLIWLGLRPLACSYENGNQPSVSLEDARFRNWLSYYQLLNKGFAV